MAHEPDVTQLWDELIDAFEWGEEDRARALVSRLAAQPRRARVKLDEMLASPDANNRRAAVFGLGELGGTASVKRLEQQMAIEEARNDYDGESVLEVITQTLGRIKDTGARASLIRRLKRLVIGKPEKTDVNDVAYALWRKRHPELISVVRNALEQLPPRVSPALYALLYLLETPPGTLVTWALDASVPLEQKTNVLTILDEEVPDELLSVISAFIAAAASLDETTLIQNEDASYYCDRLFTTLLLHRERVLPALPPKVRSELRSLACKCLASIDASCSIRAACMLQYVGRPEDAPLLETHRPTDEVLAKVYDDTARALRSLLAD